MLLATAWLWMTTAAAAPADDVAPEPFPERPRAWLAIGQGVDDPEAPIEILYAGTTLEVSRHHELVRTYHTVFRIDEVPEGGVVLPARWAWVPGADDKPDFGARVTRPGQKSTWVTVEHWTERALPPTRPGPPARTWDVTVWDAKPGTVVEFHTRIEPVVPWPAGGADWIEPIAHPSMPVHQRRVVISAPSEVGMRVSTTSPKPLRTVTAEGQTHHIWRHSTVAPVTDDLPPTLVRDPRPRITMSTWPSWEALAVAADGATFDDAEPTEASLRDAIAGARRVAAKGPMITKPIAFPARDAPHPIYTMREVLRRDDVPARTVYVRQTPGHLDPDDLPALGHFQAAGLFTTAPEMRLWDAAGPDLPWPEVPTAWVGRDALFAGPAPEAHRRLPTGARAWHAAHTLDLRPDHAAHQATVTVQGDVGLRRALAMLPDATADMTLGAALGLGTVARPEDAPAWPRTLIATTPPDLSEEEHTVIVRAPTLFSDLPDPEDVAKAKALDIPFRLPPATYEATWTVHLAPGTRLLALPPDVHRTLEAFTFDVAWQRRGDVLQGRATLTIGPGTASAIAVQGMMDAVRRSKLKEGAPLTYALPALE